MTSHPFGVPRKGWDVGHGPQTAERLSTDIVSLFQTAPLFETRDFVEIGSLPNWNESHPPFSARMVFGADKKGGLHPLLACVPESASPFPLYFPKSY